MLKKIIVILLSFVLCIQAIPILQVGKLLFNNQLNEEVVHDIDFEKDVVKNINNKSDFLQPEILFASIYNHHSFHSYTQFSETIPLNHSYDIHVPPPNK